MFTKGLQSKEENRQVINYHSQKSGKDTKQRYNGQKQRVEGVGGKGRKIEKKRH